MRRTVYVYENRLGNNVTAATNQRSLLEPSANRRYAARTVRLQPNCSELEFFCCYIMAYLKRDPRLRTCLDFYRNHNSQRKDSAANGANIVDRRQEEVVAAAPVEKQKQSEKRVENSDDNNNDDEWVPKRAAKIMRRRNTVAVPVIEGIFLLISPKKMT